MAGSCNIAGRHGPSYKNFLYSVKPQQDGKPRTRSSHNKKIYEDISRSNRMFMWSSNAHNGGKVPI